MLIVECCGKVSEGYIQVINTWNFGIQESEKRCPICNKVPEKVLSCSRLQVIEN